MQLGISTRVLLQHRLQTAHLDAFARAGATHIELFAARHHFDYTDRLTLRETAAWFRSNDAVPSLHQPIYADAHWTRHTAPNLNLISLSKTQRIEAADEVKRAIEIAESIPIRSVVLHLGLPHDPSSVWSEQTIDHALTALEHLKAFAAPLGVQLLLENLLTDVANPRHLLEILRIGHFDAVGICFNAAHAHLAPSLDPAQKDHGILPALDLLQPRIAALHLSDNDGRADQHSWPAVPPSGGIDWPTILPHLNNLPAATPAILEIAPDQSQSVEDVCKELMATSDRFRRTADSVWQGSTR